MAAMSALPTAASGLTPPSSSHGSGSSNTNGQAYTWDSNFSAENDENAMPDRKATNGYDAPNGHPRSHMISHNGNPPYFAHTAAPIGPTPKDSDSNLAGTPAAAYLSPPYGPGASKSASTKDAAAGSPDSLPDAYASSRGTKRMTAEISPTGSFGDMEEDSKWIHRDKLARIESEELQAAGIILPAPRSQSRSRHTQERPIGPRKSSDADLHASARPRKNSSAVSGSAVAAAPTESRASHATAPSWDLRLPEEIAEAEEANYWTSTNGVKGSSRIPVAKLSPVPIPTDVLERDTPARRRRDSSPNDEAAGIKMPRTRARSSSTSTKLEATAAAAIGTTPQPKRAVTDVSPKKTAGTAVRKGSGKSGPNGRPKTRGAPSKDSTSSGTGTTRPSTRSGDRELSTASPVNNMRPPEGDPPWMVSAYKPDPRLPPDQQLLPTVAKRLQQEKWEREGKFGSVYDREFRPLTDDGFLSPPEPKDKLAAGNDPNEKADHKGEDWPLKAEPKSPTAPSLRQQRTGSYSTIPKVQDPPQSPLPPPSRGNTAPAQPSPLIRIPDVPDDDPKQEKKGCMCCIVM